jgi:hypothetical protein
MVGDKLEIKEFDGKRLQAVESDGSCSGCEYEEGWNCLDILKTHPCTSTKRYDRKEVIWLKIQHGKDPRLTSVQEVKDKVKTLQQTIQELISTFEGETATKVSAVDFTACQEIGGASCTYDVAITVTLN